MEEHIVIGLDTGKNIFHVWEANRHGGSRVRRKYNRRKLLDYLSNHVGSLVGLEACSGSNHLARKLTQLGHTVALMSPQHVKPYVKSNKNDFNDAEGSWEAVQRPTMRFVPVKTVSQQELLVLHRVREQADKQRKAISNQIRGVLREFGLVVAKGIPTVRRRLPELLEDAENDLTPPVREVLSELGEELRRLEERFSHYTVQLRVQAREREDCQRLRTVPGIGELIATATVAKAGDGGQFCNGRHFAAWMGLVPRQHTTGGKTRLGRISKRGDRYLRTMFIHGGRSLLAACSRRDDALSRWAMAVLARRGWNIAVVALANKLARIAWAVLTQGTTYDAKRPVV